MKATLLLALTTVGRVLTGSPPGDVVGKLAVGYQGWFAVEGDGSPMNRWIHWSEDREMPHKGHQKFEIWPDVREYTNLYDTGYRPLGNGEPPRLFSSWDDQTVDTHFKWMKENNIDVAALQRFAGNARDPVARDQMAGIAKNVMRNAEKHGVKFYVMYDISGWNTFATELIDDLDANLTPLGLFDSEAYARQNGKPVICVWGFGFTDRPDDPAGALGVIDALKGRGYYVAGGVPTDWRDNGGDSLADYQEVYLRLDMLQPWAVGRFGGVDGAEGYKSRLEADFETLNRHGIDFQPVLFPGFAWSNWNGGAPNQIPRLHGDFMWRQFVNVRELNITNAYVAMFDEYDEGTAIAKAAENVSMIPTDQYFLTLDADGVRVSSDFYLRLVGDGNRMMKGEIPLQTTHPTPHVP